MAKDKNKQWRCQDCNEISLEKDLLRAQSPFDPDSFIVGCPLCKGAEGFDEICDESGCESQATCGFPTGEEYGGYRRTCSKHNDAFNAPKPL